MKRFFVILVILTLFFSIGCRRNKIKLQQRVDADNAACEYAKNANDANVWENYLKKFPKGKCAFEAESEIEKLKKQ